jgi:transcriptional antiterminator RfaH
MAELSAPVWCGSEPAWFCVRTHLKHEHSAEAHLSLIPGVQAFNPRIRLLRATRRGPVWFTESLFPNYVFARFVWELDLEKVMHTTSVTSVLRFGNMVSTIPDTVISEIQQCLEEMKSKLLTDAPGEGEEVEIVEGALKGLNGTVWRVLQPQQRVQVLFDLMGRSITAEMNLASVFFRRREAANLVLPGVEGLSRRETHSLMSGRTL